MRKPADNISIADFVNLRNNEKQLFTPGPASLLVENIIGLRSCFGRGDSDYVGLEDSVLNSLKRISGQENIIRIQGSASLALEIMALNFLSGNILIVSTGYYSDRFASLANISQRNNKNITNIDLVPWDKVNELSANYDWVLACPTETSCGLKIDIKYLKGIADKAKAKLMLDATASIGLEEDHELADVVGFSSCKGLFGLTGASFICYNALPRNDVDSFYLRIDTHENKMMTGPYHAICSLAEVLPVHSKIRESIIINKKIFIEKMKNYLVHPLEMQPLLCTFVNCKIVSKNNSNILYSSRSLLNGTVVCHLGEAHLKSESQGSIQSDLLINED